MKLSPKDRILVALDVDDLEKMKSLIARLLPLVGGFKVGLELLMALGARAVMQTCKEFGIQVFLDGKLKDIGNTMKGATRSVVGGALPPWMINTHLLGISEESLKTTYEAAERYIQYGRRPLIVGVTVLTDVTYEDLVKQRVLPPLTEAERRLPEEEQKDLKSQRIRALVCDLAVFAQGAKFDGVVASAQEAAAIRKACGKDFLIVTPGIRPDWAKKNEQERVTTPAQALANGADFIVIGRPITDPPGGMTPKDAVGRIVEEINGEQKSLELGGP
jgi:orotidine-5'-phosphate decarboxylase